MNINDWTGIPLILTSVLRQTLTFPPVVSDVAGQQQQREKTEGLKNIPDIDSRRDPGGDLMTLKRTKPTGWKMKKTNPND